MITFEDLGLQKFAKNKQYQKYLNVLNRFVDKKSKEKNISHIFVGGSFINGNLNTFSDLDFYIVDSLNKVIIGKEEKDYIDGIKIDYIIVSRESILPEIKKENESFYRFFSTCFANSKIIWGNDDFDDVIELAKKSAKSKIKKFTKEEINNALNFLIAQKRESKILYEKNDIIGFHLRLNHLVHTCVEYYFKFQEIPKPPWKRISENIQDKEFFSLINNAVTEKDNLEKYVKICLMMDYCILKFTELQKK